MIVRSGGPPTSLLGDHDEAGNVIQRQLLWFVGVGLVAMLAHYGLLIGLVESRLMAPVQAALVGFCVGGLVSYVLNRRHTFASDRPHAEALWRFAIVAGVSFCLTYVFMHIFVDRLGAPYIPAQVVTTGIVMFWSFAANKLWTFGLAAESDAGKPAQVQGQLAERRAPIKRGEHHRP
jgi:putative flippase GtrA